MLDIYMKRRLINYHIASRRTRLTTEQGYDVAFMPKGREPQSAQWRYDNTRKRHNLVFNEAVDEIADKPSLHRYDRMKFAEKVYDHEGAHSLFTDRDNPKLCKAKDKAKVPFHLWNLFEDARIEAQWRRKIGRRFNWLRYVLLCDERKPDLLEPIPTGPINAILLFLDCTHMENSFRKLSEWIAADKDPKIAYRGKGKAKYGRRSLVRFFYRRAIKTHDTMGLLPIIKDWLETFPETGAGSGMPGEGEGAGACSGPGTGDMQDPSSKEGGEMPSDAQGADGEKHEPIKETCEPEPGSGAGEGGAGTKPEGKEVKYVDDEISKPVAIPKNHFFNASITRPIDTKRADGLIHLFERFLEGGEGMVTSRNPSGKIDMRKFLRGAEDIYIRKGDDPAGVKRISFILDASGSMGSTVGEGLYLAYVLNELVRRRKIECKSMILSGGNNYSVPMPFDPRLLEKVMTPGGIEGFANTMREHEKDLVASDFTIFYSDFDITDEHINKAEWHRKGVYTIGLFCGPASRAGVGHKWFDTVLVRDSIEAIADSLIQIIKR